jgi:hypothetical protein
VRVDIANWEIEIKRPLAWQTFTPWAHNICKAGAKALSPFPDLSSDRIIPENPFPTKSSAGELTRSGEFSADL